MSRTLWLLLLGSNDPDDARLWQALQRLAEFGRVDCLGVHHLPPREGEGAWFYNALVRFETGLAAPELKVVLRAIEVALGRDRNTPLQVAIDIDILACDRQGWLADRHAQDKGDLTGWPASQLLAEAGLQVRHAD